ncbi:MAG: autotransporter-associated beta strand repeat-containing protein [Verrucomicrobiota bacterium]
MKPRLSIQNLTSSCRAHSIFLAAITVLLVSQSAQAQSGTWTNPVSGGLWSDPANWNLLTVADGTDSTADFSTLDIAADNTVSLDTVRTIGNLIFADATTPSNNWIVDNAATPANILTLANTSGKPTITVTDQFASLNLVLAGGNGFTKAGAGELILNGTNTLTGSVLLTGGTLSIGSGAINTATAGTGSIVMGNGSTLRLNTTSTTFFPTNNIVISGAGANATLTSGALGNGFAGPVSGSSDQTLTIGDGNVSFSGTTQQFTGFLGTVSIAATKLLRFSSNSGTADVGGSNTTFDVNGTILARNAFAGIHLGALSGLGTLNGGATGVTPVGIAPWIIGEKNTDSAFQGTINNGTGLIPTTSSLTKRGTGTLTLNGAAVHTYTSSTNANRGTLLLDFVNLVTPTDLINAGSALGLGGGTFSIKGQATGTTDQTFASTNVNAGASTIVLNPNGGTATNLNLNAITRNQGSTLNYTPVAGGTVNTTTVNPLITGGQATILGGYATVNANTWAVSGTGAPPFAITGLPTGSYTNTAVTALSAAGTLDVDVAAAGTNTTGALTVNSLRFDDSSAPTAVTLSGLLTVATGGILVTSNVGANPTTISGGSLTSGLNAGASGDIIVIQNNTAASLTISSVISGTRGFTKSGAGTVIITGTNTITGGGTHINGGTLQLGDGSAAVVIGGTGNSMNLNGGTLVLNVPNGTAYANSVVNISANSGIRNGFASGNVQVSANYAATQGPVTLNLSSAGGQITHAGTESGFSGTIAMTGATAFTYRLNNTANTNTGSPIALYDLGTTTGNTLLNRNGGAVVYNLGGLAGGTGTILRGAPTASASTTCTYSIGALNTSTTFDGRILDGTAAAAKTAITKVGTGTLTLTNAGSTYTGNTTVSNGTLSLANAFLNDASTLSISAANGVLNLPHSNTDIVAAMVVNGTPVANGVYGAIGATGVDFNVFYITGTGKIHVTPSYASWASTNAGSQAANLDFDNDGVKNGVEYFMGATGSTFTPNPTIDPVTNKVIWPKNPAFLGSYTVQTSPDLVNWTDVSSNVVGNNVEYTAPIGQDKWFIRLDVVTTD